MADVYIGVEEGFSFDHQGRDIFPGCDLEDACSWFVANDVCYVGYLRVSEMIDDLLSIASGTGGENGDIFQSDAIGCCWRKSK